MEDIYARKSDEHLLGDQEACVTIARQYQAVGNMGQAE